MSTAVEELRVEVVSLRTAVQDLLARLAARDAEDLVSASEAESILRLRHGTVRTAALAGQIPYAARRARHGEQAIFVSMAAARSIWGPR